MISVNKLIRAIENGVSMNKWRVAQMLEYADQARNCGPDNPNAQSTRKSPRRAHQFRERLWAGARGNRCRCRHAASSSSRRAVVNQAIRQTLGVKMIPRWSIHMAFGRLPETPASRALRAIRHSVAADGHQYEIAEQSHCFAIL